jgi:hypothetical protein
MRDRGSFRYQTLLNALHWDLVSLPDVDCPKLSSTKLWMGSIASPRRASGFLQRYVMMMFDSGIIQIIGACMELDTAEVHRLQGNKMSEEIDKDRRNFLRNAAMTVAAGRARHDQLCACIVHQPGSSARY